MTKLSDTQVLILSAAAQHPELVALPLPSSLRGGAAAKVVGSMIAKGFLEEVEADMRKGEAVWRETGDGHGVTLVATDAGLAAISFEKPDPTECMNTEEYDRHVASEGRVAALAEAVAAIRAASADDLAVAVLNETPAVAAAAEMLRSGDAPAHHVPRSRQPRSEGPNKREIAAGLLTRPEGCTARDILDATGWPAVSVPAIAKASGLKLREEKDGRAKRYFGTAA